MILSEKRLISYGVKGAKTISPLGSIFLIEPEVPHFAQVESKQPAWGALRTLLIPRSCFADYLGEAAARHELTFASPISADPALMKKLDRMHVVISTTQDQLASESAIVVSLEQLSLQTRHAPSKLRTAKSEKKMRMVRAQLGSDLFRSLSLSEIAAEVQLSPYHVIRQFHELFGLSPHAFRTQLRIARARDLLLSKLPISEVAQMAGFSDHAHLTRSFHRIVGVPPSRYRNSNFVQDERQRDEK